MNLTAALVVRNELGRYLEPCVTHLLEFCDQIVVLDDASDDGTREWLIDHPDDRIHVVTQSKSTFYAHEGQTRQTLLDETLSRKATHVLSIDADEFVDDGTALRYLIGHDQNQPVWSLRMEEVWNADAESLWTREDGGWRSHQLPVVWKAPGVRNGSWRMLDKKLACRRVPIAVLREGGRAAKTGAAVLHFGWADPSTRRQRYDRYTQHDGGRFHASRHLSSIMWPESRVELHKRAWPAGEVFDSLRSRFAAVAA